MASGSESFDVVVVGAGIGGLTAGALLAARGMSVLVLERRQVPGGCCSALEVDGYRFDIASSLFYGFGPEGFNANRRVLDELGVDLEMVHHKPCFKMHFEGDELPVHEDLESWLGELGRAFPSCVPGLRAFYEQLEGLYRDALAVGFMPVADASLFQLTRVAFGTPSILFKYLPKLNQTLWSLLGPLLADADPLEVRKLKTLIDVDMAFGTCTPSHELPLLLAVPILMDRHVGGVRYPIGGAGAVAQALVRGLRKHGGEVRYGASVRKIVTRRGRAVGVELESGESIRAGKVVCNANIWDAFGGLVDEASVSRSRRQKVEALEPSFSVFITCVSLDAEHMPDGFHNHTVVIPNHVDGLDATSIIYAPTVDDPSLAPEGKHAVTLINVTDYKAWCPPGSDWAEPNEALDRQHVARALELAEEVLPGITEHGEVKGALSPVWLERTLGRRYGTVGGPAQTVEQSLNRRQGNRTEIDELFLVGDSTFPGEGVVAVTISGLTCADQIRPAGEQSVTPEVKREVVPKRAVSALDKARSALGFWRKVG